MSVFLCCLAFLICSEYLFWMLALSLAYKADTQVGAGLQVIEEVYSNWQNCLLAFLACFELIF